MEKIKKWLKENGLSILVVLLLSLSVFIVYKKLNKVNDNPAINRLVELNDSLIKENAKNKLLINNLFNAIDSISIEQQIIYDRRPIINNTYTDEIYNIVNADYSRDNTDYLWALQFSDSLLKTGFYYRTYELPEATVRP